MRAAWSSDLRPSAQDYLGLKIAADETNAERDFGIHIIPDREARFTLTSADRLIVLAEDET
jgi:hypothetical protein